VNENKIIIEGEMKQQVKIQTQIGYTRENTEKERKI
jgi:hypothetical protein